MDERIGERVSGSSLRERGAQPIVANGRHRLRQGGLSAQSVEPNDRVSAGHVVIVCELETQASSVQVLDFCHRTSDASHATDSSVVLASASTGFAVFLNQISPHLSWQPL